LNSFWIHFILSLRIESIDTSNESFDIVARIALEGENDGELKFKNKNMFIEAKSIASHLVHSGHAQTTQPHQVQMDCLLWCFEP
jgi:hypothetical protein